MFSNIKAVRVQEIIMSGSTHVIGTIKYNDINDPVPITTAQLPSARPLFYNFSQYPTVNELVYILAAPKSDYNTKGGIMEYYLPPINIFGAPNHNALVNQLNPFEYKRRKETSFKGYFQERPSIKPLLPYEGDVMVEGRFGNSIRFGSTISGSHEPNNWSLETSQSIGNPITIIRNGQSTTVEEQNLQSNHILEDINKDNSSIYLCSEQQITNFQKAGVGYNTHELSYKHMLEDE